jgi:anti-sigma B factor antagonist
LTSYAPAVRTIAVAVTPDDDVQPNNIQAGSDELLQWSVVRSRGAVVVSLVGEVDLSTADALSALLAEVVADKPPLVAVDVGGVSFLDSSGIKCLVDAAMCAASTGCRLVVRSPTSTIEQVFSICGVHDLLLDGSGGDASEGR